MCRELLLSVPLILLSLLLLSSWGQMSIFYCNFLWVSFWGLFSVLQIFFSFRDTFSSKYFLKFSIRTVSWIRLRTTGLETFSIRYDLISFLGGLRRSNIWNERTNFDRCHFRIGSFLWNRSNLAVNRDKCWILQRLDRQPTYNLESFKICFCP